MGRWGFAKRKQLLSMNCARPEDALPSSRPEACMCSDLPPSQDNAQRPPGDEQREEDAQGDELGVGHAPPHLGVQWTVMTSCSMKYRR